MAARGLGKGLDSMIPKSIQQDIVVEKEIEKSGGVANETLVSITKVEPNRDQPRKNFDKEELESLAESIKQHGMISPIIVQDRKTHYEIIAGERRWRAARIAGLKEIPVIVRDYTDQERAEITIIENIQREDFNPVEEAQAYKSLMTDYNLTQDEVAKKVSKSRAAIANSLRLLKLSDAIQKMLINKSLTEGHARALLSIEDTKIQDSIAKQIVNEKLTVRDVEKLVKNYGKPVKIKEEKSNEYDVFYQDIAESLKVKLGTKVKISGKGDGSGKIEIEFYSNDELDRITSALK